MHLVLKRRVAAGGEQRSSMGARLAQRLDPGPVALGKIRQHVAVHQFLDAGMTDPKPHPAILVADMRGDRAQPVVAGNAAADLDAHFRRRQFEFVLKHGDLSGGELEEVRGFLNRAPGLVHEGGRLEHNDLLAVERAFGSLALKTAAPWSETMTPRNFIDGHKPDVVAGFVVLFPAGANSHKQTPDAAAPPPAPAPQTVTPLFSAHPPLL